jgi:UDP-glucose:(heptosyl)LPS alpha-1,3-glucosyltransferase
MESKIALVIKDFDPGLGGGERYSVSLARALQKQGIALDVLCRSAAKALQKEFSIHMLTIPRTSLSRSVDFDQAFQKFISTHPYSCVVGLTQVRGCDIYRLGGGLLSVWDSLQYSGFYGKMKKIFSWNHRLNLQLEKKILEHPRLRFLVVNSELVRAQVLEKYPSHRERVFLIENAVEQEIFFQKNKNPEEKKSFLKSLGLFSGEITLLFAANNFERKGLFFLLDALSELPEQFSLIVAGRGDQVSTKKILSQKGLGSRVVFTESYSNMADLYNAADLFVLPTQYDPCSNACLEALACGLPVITTEKNGASMYLKTGAGIVIASQAMKETLKEALLFGSTALTPMKQKAAQAVSSLTFQKNAEGLIPLIRRVQTEPSSY